MRDTTLVALSIIFIVLAIVNLAAHSFLVCALVRKEGPRRVPAIPWWQFMRQLNEYREILRARSDSLSPYYILLLMRLFNVALGVIILLRWLWLFNNPPV
jgi:hypothetical protein